MSRNRVPTSSLPRLLVAAACASCIGGGACSQPVDPGSDLPGEAPPARLGPEIDTGRLGDVSAARGTDVTGDFQLEARVESSLGGGTIPIGIPTRLDQSGEIQSGRATLAITLQPPEGASTSEASSDEPAELSEQGGFETSISGYTVPASTSEMLSSNTDATVRLEGQILDSHCIRGDAEITLRNVESPQGTLPELTLTGPFEAVRRGRSCDGGGADAGRPSDTEPNDRSSRPSM
jgi:hypothetical protein